MLAEPRQKRGYILTPRAQPLYEDANRFGSRMLEKMGWAKGKGLGVNEDGIQDFVRPRYKLDNRGLGFQDRDDQWTQHEDCFNGLLKSLNDGNANCEKMSENDTTRINPFRSNTESIETATDTSKKLKEKTSGMSLEERPRKSKARVHYKKFTKGKDLSQYSEKDLANIFGKTFTEENKVTNHGDRKTSSPVASKAITYETNPFNTMPSEDIIEDNVNKENMKKKKVRKDSDCLINEKEILKLKHQRKLVNDNVADKSEAFKELAAQTSTLMTDEDSSKPSSKKKSVKPVSTSSERSLTKTSDTEAHNSNLTKIGIEAAATDITRVERKKTAIEVQEADKAVKKKSSKREGHAVHEAVENNADAKKVHVSNVVGNELEMFKQFDSKSSALEGSGEPSKTSSKKKIVKPLSKSNDTETDDSNSAELSVENVVAHITGEKKNKSAIEVQESNKAVKKKPSKQKVHVVDEAVEMHALSDLRDEVFKQFDAEKSALATDADSSQPLSKKNPVKSVIKSSDTEADSGKLAKIDIEAVPAEASRLKRKEAAIGGQGKDKDVKKKSNKRESHAVHETFENNADTRNVHVLGDVGHELEMFEQLVSKNWALAENADYSKEKIVKPVSKSNDTEAEDSNLTKVDLETIPADVNRVKRKAKGVQESNKAVKKKVRAIGEVIENNTDTGEVPAVNEATVDTWPSPTEEEYNKPKNKEKNSKKQRKRLLVQNEENGKDCPSKKSQDQSESETNHDSLIVQNCDANTGLDELEKFSFKESSLNSLCKKHEKSNMYEISSFCAEKFRNADIQKFPGSSLSQVEGYSLNADTILDVQDKKNDEERITNLWKCTLDKYDQLEKPKKTYQSYVKQLIQAKKHKQKRPKLYVKSWKRKSAFQPI
uniref:G-patch domain-containing protein n=1 Tax=Glossina palpalis gambiensis TaxID=67801 RepID=A0A1B0C039_9MUSC